jgi:hypothetical protein
MMLCSVEESDEIWVISGCQMPLVLQLQKTGSYVLVRVTNISGLMEGEVVKSLPESLSGGWQAALILSTLSPWLERTSVPFPFSC